MSSKDVAVFGLELPARTLACVAASPKPPGVAPDPIHRFVAATASPRGNNSVNLLEYHEGRKVVECAAVWNHPSEVLHLALTPLAYRSYFLTTIHPSFERSGAAEVSFFVLPQSDEGLHELRPIGSAALDAVAVALQLPSDATTVGAASTPPVLNAAAVCRSGEVAFLRVEEGLDRLTVVSTAAVSDEQKNSLHAVGAATWDLANRYCAYVAAGNASSVYRVDMREPLPELRAELVCPRAHNGAAVRRLTNSIGRLHTLLTAGEDGVVRAWDVRRTGECLLSFLAHDHFVLDVAVNEHQPELVATVGADRSTRLWRVPALGARRAAAAGEGGSTTAASLLRRSEHRDTVCAATWSGPWVYAAASFDGGVTIDQVPFDMRSQLLISA